LLFQRLLLPGVNPLILYPGCRIYLRLSAEITGTADLALRTTIPPRPCWVSSSWFCGLPMLPASCFWIAPELIYRYDQPSGWIESGPPQSLCWREYPRRVGANTMLPSRAWRIFVLSLLERSRRFILRPRQVGYDSRHPQLHASLPLFRYIRPIE